MTLSGFGNHHQTEAIENALPKNQNSPLTCAYGLYAEQLSGSAFTTPRPSNLHSWLYRKLPSVVNNNFKLYPSKARLVLASEQAPNPYRWNPFINEQHGDFIDGLQPIAGTSLHTAFIFQCASSMTNRYFSNSDGELLFVPYEGEAELFTEMGVIQLLPGSIAIIPRGVRFKMTLRSDTIRGYLCENRGLPLTLPSLGILGANGLANPRHFIYPTAAFEDSNDDCQIICKFNNQYWQTSANSSPLNVVAWHGNYAPYTYDLSLFNTINTVSFDHPDPSIFTVLTSESVYAGIANLDFVIFPPRWMVAEHTFRPPYFHRNIMSEFMGLIKGEYDAKKEGFLPGGISIHNCMTGHGPDRIAYTNALKSAQKPEFYDNTLAFMFETNEPWMVSEKALNHPNRQLDYSQCWKGFMEG